LPKLLFIVAGHWIADPELEAGTVTGHMHLAEREAEEHSELVASVCSMVLQEPEEPQGALELQAVPKAAVHPLGPLVPAHLAVALGRPH